MFYLTHTAQPLIRLQAFSKRTILGGSLIRIVLSSAPFILPLMFQVTFGWSPLTVGSLLLALFENNIAFKFITTPLIRRFSFLLIINGIQLSFSFVLCSMFTT